MGYTIITKKKVQKGLKKLPDFIQVKFQYLAKSLERSGPGSARMAQLFETWGK
jgi:hypothetical protein